MTSRLSVCARVESFVNRQDRECYNSDACVPTREKIAVSKASAPAFLNATGRNKWNEEEEDRGLYWGGPPKIRPRRRKPGARLKKQIS